MPNWCTTLIELRGNNIESIRRLINDISSGGDDVPGSKYRAVDFNKIIPQPDHIYQGPLGPNEKDIYGEENCWYDWSIQNWGTKWNCYNSVSGFCNNPDIDTYVLIFDTAWSCPTKVIGRMALLHKDIDFTVCWWEEGGQSDWFEIKGSDRRVTKEKWDEPSFDDIMDYISFAREDTEPTCTIPKTEN